MSLLRLPVIWMILITVSTSQKGQYLQRKEVAGYPSQVHQMFRQQQFKSNKSKIEGVWSGWSPWSPCSRTCGGGVTQQIRQCIPKKNYFNNPEKQLEKLKSKKGGTRGHCVGIYKRFHYCNPQKCPRERDFRSEQCHRFDKYPFKGKLYYWEPFLKAGDECALNCRPLGLRFYATLNKTVIDGTWCKHPLTSTGKAAPSGTKGVCVNGRCKSVASNGVIGAIDELPEECSACSKGLCKSVSGIYTKPDLPPGYSLVAQIPEGACKINVQQLQPTTNNIALKNSNGSFIINGDWKFSPSTIVESYGTRFIYTKGDGINLETVTAVGPLIQPVDIFIVYQQANLGIKYGYMLPIKTTEQIAPPYLKHPGIEPRRLDLPITQRDEARTSSTHRRRVRRRYIWKLGGESTCSKTCGGGVQTKLFVCVREHNQTPVTEKRCNHLERPASIQTPCNTESCPSSWKGTWGSCTGSCGQGVQHFIVHCQRETSEHVLIVSDGICQQPKPSASSRSCKLPLCETDTDNEVHQVSSSNRVDLQEWDVGPWSQCSVSCGTGHRSRTVTCASGRCSYEKRPSHAEYCDSGSCAIHGNASSWLVSEWSSCSEACGTGTQDRLAMCSASFCESNAKPEVSRPCSSDRYCTGQWFVGPWGSCSESCKNVGKQLRDITCVVKVRGQLRITNDMTCSSSDKPLNERLCQSDCPARWFVGEWGFCEGNCPAGVQRREAKCLDKNGLYSNACSDDDKPLNKRTCKCDKKDDQINIPAHDEPQDNSCVDKFSNCYLAVKARLCHYEYYTSNCCVSCRKLRQDLKQ